MAGHQPPPPPPFAVPVYQNQWSSGLSDCFLDIPICCLACCCPCITFGQIAEIVDNGETSCGVHGTIYALLNVIGCGCLYSCGKRTKMRRQFGLTEAPANDCCGKRTKMRRQFGLTEAPANDCCVHFCCEPCALSQEYRELRHNGIDLSLGWEGNAARWPPNIGVQMAPIAPGGMYHR